MKTDDFVFMVFAGEPFTSLGVPRVDLPIPGSIATALAKTLAHGQELPLDLPTLRDFVTVCCREYPQSATRCVPAHCCISFLLGRHALNGCAQMLSSEHDFDDPRFIGKFSARIEYAREQLAVACDLCDRWAEAPAFLRHNAHWHMARLHMLAQSEDAAIAELEAVMAICGSDDLVPDVWFGLAGILFDRKNDLGAVNILDDYVHRAKTLFPERSLEFLMLGRYGEFAQQYPMVRRYFEKFEG